MLDQLLDRVAPSALILSDAGHELMPWQCCELVADLVLACDKLGVEIITEDALHVKYSEERGDESADLIWQFTQDIGSLPVYGDR